ncbi:hypothetical protein GCM10009637_26010 [Brevibacterium luteolum]
MPVAQQGQQDPVDGLMLADDRLADLRAHREEPLAQLVIAVGQLVFGGQSLVKSRLHRARGGGRLAVGRHLAVRLAWHLSGSRRVPRLLAGLLDRHLPGLGCVLWRQRRLTRLHTGLTADRTTGLAADRYAGPARLTARPERTSGLSRLLAGLLRMVGSVGHVGETSLSMAVMRTAMSESCRSLAGTPSR